MGENSDIPNVNGMRKDVVEALKEIQRITALVPMNLWSFVDSWAVKPISMEIWEAVPYRK